MVFDPWISSLSYLEWKTGRVQCKLHVKIYKQKYIYIPKCIFSCGLLVNNGEKNAVVLNNRRHLLISHSKEIQLGSM